MAQVLDMPLGDIRAIHRQGPGCYGHNGLDDVALDAALLAKAVPGRPVLSSGAATTKTCGSRSARLW